MIPEEKINWFKKYLHEAFVENCLGADPDFSMSKEDKNAFREAYTEMGYIDYIYTNCYKIMMSDEELEKWIDKTKIIDDAANDLRNVVGDKRFEDITIHSGLKIENWMDLNGEELGHLITEKIARGNV